MTDAPVAAPKGPPYGFSKDVNTYMNSFITLCHTKAGAVLGASLTLSGLLLRDASSFGAARWCAHYSAILCLLAAAFLSAKAIFPRLKVRRGGGGFIFWEDVRHYGSPEHYYETVQGLDQAAVEKEYCYTNFLLSIVLHDKYVLLQYAIASLTTGAFLAGVSRIL